MPGEYFFSILTEKNLSKKDSGAHTGIKPYIHFFSQKYEHVTDTHRVFKYVKNNPVLNAIFYTHLVRAQAKDGGFRLRIDPIINFERGRDFAEKENITFSTNTRGFIGSGFVGQKLYFESMVVENQSFFPNYLANSANSSSVIPGQGRWKTFKDLGYDYAFSSGFFSVQIFKNVNLQVGHGKQKVGHGYRSLLLSDNSFNYPYARVTQQWFKGRLQYNTIYALLMNLVPSSKKVALSTERMFQKKAASFQYLSYNLGSSVNIGFFQALVWEAGDERNRQHLNWQYFNPVIYTQLLQYGLNNRNNIVAGGDAKIKVTNKINVYTQLMADQLGNANAQGWGWQAGFNVFDFMGMKNFFLQAEFNYIGSSSYDNVSQSTTNQSYTHYGQGLAYTPSNGREIVFIANYQLRRWIVNIKYNRQDIPSGGTPFYLNQIICPRLSYLINPAYNLNITMGYNYRYQNFYTFKTLNNYTSYLFVGLKTSLFNFYYDF